VMIAAIEVSSCIEWLLFILRGCEEFAGGLE